MKLACLFLLCFLGLGYSVKMLAQQCDQLISIKDSLDLNSTSRTLAPEIYSFNERVLLWESIFGDYRRNSFLTEFSSRIRNELRESTHNSILSVVIFNDWDWRVTNTKTKNKFSPNDRRLKKDYLRALWAPYGSEEADVTTYDLSMNNQNPYKRQITRMNLINFPRLYFIIQMFSFIQIIDEFIRQIPTSYRICNQWKISYRKEMLVFTYTH